MSNKQDLETLLAKVEAGWRFLLTPCHKTGQLGGTKAHLCKAAYNGSLDAALALKDAVLVGTNQYSIVTDPTCRKVSVCWWPDGISLERQYYAEAWCQENEARAILICIIKNLIEECK